METLTELTLATYGVLVVLWTIILFIYVKYYRESKPIDLIFTPLLVILIIDAFRTLFESLFFGIYFHSFYGFLAPWIHELLGDPRLLVVPKLLNVFTALLVLTILLHRWLPNELKRREKTKAAAEENRRRYECIFNNAEVAIWDQDFLEVYGGLARLRAEGVKDLRSHLAANPELAWKMAAPVKVNDVNKASLRIFGATSKEEFVKSIHKVFGPETTDLFIDVLVSIWEGREIFHTETTLSTFDGKKIIVTLTMPIPKSPEEFHSIPVSLVDITQRRKAEDALRESERRLRTTINNAPVVLFALDQGGKFTVSEGKGLAPLGLLPGEVVGRSVFEMYAGYPAMIEQIRRALAGERFSATVKLDDRFLETAYNPIEDKRGEVTEIIGVATDITPRKQAEKDLRILWRAIEQSPVSVLITDRNGAIQYANPFFEKSSGYSEEEVIGRTPDLLKSDHTPADAYNSLWDTIRSGQTWRGEILNKKKSGELYWEYISVSPISGEDGAISHFVSIQEDISFRKKQEEKIIRQAHFDNLTGLPNRLLAMDRLSQTMKSAFRESKKVVLMFIDLDNFKKVNDTLGHEVGDQLLLEASSRCRAVIRDADTVARLGGDEFLITVGDLTRTEDAKIIAEKILLAFSTPFKVGALELIVTASIGLAFYPDDGMDPVVLLRNAEAAMYRAKEEGRDVFHFFEPSLNEEALQRLEMERYMHRGLENREFFLRYQPLVNAETSRVEGAEVLLRWQNPELGLVAPDRFIPVAEQNGLIVSIGEWVLMTACRQARAWVDQGHAPFRLAVNVSPRQFRGGFLTQVIRRILGESGLPAHCLEIEVTEGLLIKESPVTRETLNDLSAMGIHLSLDDFGTGYSSLSYLRNFPFNTLKIDRSFIRDLVSNPEDRALVIATLAMARGLGLSVIAEGVETLEQLAFLRAHGCPMVQGYFFSKPLLPEEFCEFPLILDSVGG